MITDKDVETLVGILDEGMVEYGLDSPLPIIGEMFMQMGRLPRSLNNNRTRLALAVYGAIIARLGRGETWPQARQGILQTGQKAQTMQEARGGAA